MSFPLGIFQVFMPVHEMNAVRELIFDTGAQITEPTTPTFLLIIQPIATFPSRSSADLYWRRLQEAAHEDPHGAHLNPVYRHHPRSFISNNYNYWHDKPSLQTSGVIPLVLANRGESGTTALLPYDEQCPDNVNGES
jgi:hypothetical protein